MDVCAIPATSVPCERLCSAGAEIATDCRSCLRADRFEQLQILKHAWQGQIINAASLNSLEIEDVYLDEYKELFIRDQELVEDTNDEEMVNL
jgi:hypothetical protein